MFRRRREQKTDYQQRLSMLRSGETRLVIRRALNNFRVQIIQFSLEGDKVIAEDTSRSLKKYGWLGHCGNTSAAYLTGLLIGMKAKAKGVTSAIVDIGVQTSIKGTSLYAVAAGAKDAGLKIPVGDMVDKNRIEGKHIVAFATTLKKDDAAKYKKQFSSYLKNNLEPEKITEHFNEVKAKILKEGVKPKEEKLKQVN
ncbi:MAG: 50S ribosomal protein L18 [Candidatus Aenigmarchaeota archaeon]|nr:50S ribosomal protein L18 [Candidatus Aenigmarchaeota archaeon]